MKKQITHLKIKLFNFYFFQPVGFISNVDNFHLAKCIVRNVKDLRQQVEQIYGLAK